MHDSSLRGRKVLLVNPAGWQKESINLGLCCLAGALDANGAQTLILDANRYTIEDERLARRAREFAPSLIGISVKTATAVEGARLARILAEACPNARITAGGPHITLCADSYLRDNPVYDFALMGEGEESIVRLARALDRDEDVRGLEGLVHRDGDRVVVNPWRPPENLDELAYPNLDAIEGFDWSGFRYPIVTSRGCPFECIYCCVNKLTGSKKWRARSATGVVDELEKVAREKGVTSFEIWDDNFTLNLSRAKEICRDILRRGLKLSWYCHNGIRADRVDAELADLMAKAGCTSVAFGIESGNEEVFASINKGEPLSAVVKAVRTVNKAGIKAVGYFIIGLPGDDLGKFVKSVRFQRSLPLMHYVFGMLIPYPNTRVWDIVHERGRMLCDIEETRHFGDGVVPVSFELPEFPKRDMVRAYYITKYFELFDAADRGRAGGRGATVVYVTTPPMLEHLPGMFIACGPGTRHVIIGDGVEESVRKLPAFSQVDPGTDLTFAPAGTPAQASGDDCLVIVGERRFMVRHLLLTNAAIVLFDPLQPLQVLLRAKDAIKGAAFLPECVPALTSSAMAFPRLARRFGLRKVREALGVRLARRLEAAKAGIPSGPPSRVAAESRQAAAWAVSLPARVGVAALKPAHLLAAALRPARLRAVALKTRHRAKQRLRPAAHLAFKAVGAAGFLRLKARIYCARTEKQSFPYDDYPSYM